MRHDPAALRAELLRRKEALAGQAGKGLSIVIATYNSAGKIEACLDSLRQAELKMPHEIIVVDNASTDGTRGTIDNPANLGYSRAINLGIKAAKHDQVLILNPDIIVLPGAIEVMLDYFERHPRVGLAGCKLLQ